MGRFGHNAVGGIMDWDLGGDDEKRLCGLTGVIVRNHLRLFARESETWLALGKSGKWRVCAGHLEAGLPLRKISLRGLVLEIGDNACYAEQFDPLVADLQWCIKHVNKLRARAAKARLV